MASEDVRGRVEIEHRDGVDLIELLGEHDMATSSLLREAIAEAVAADRGVVVSMSGATFVDSHVITTLFRGDAALKSRGRRLVLHVNTAAVVRRTLDLASVCDTLLCTAEIGEACSWAAREGDAAWSGP